MEAQQQYENAKLSIDDKIATDYNAAIAVQYRLDTAQDGIDLLQQIGSDRLKLNYDAGNTISHRPLGRPGGVNPADDALLAMPAAVSSNVMPA